MPLSWAASISRCETAASVVQPKFIVPRQSRLTDRPVLPRWVYCMAIPQWELVGAERGELGGEPGQVRMVIIAMSRCKSTLGRPISPNGSSAARIGGQPYGQEPQDGAHDP